MKIAPNFFYSRLNLSSPNRLNCLKRVLIGDGKGVKKKKFGIRQHVLYLQLRNC